MCPSAEHAERLRLPRLHKIADLLLKVHNPFFLDNNVFWLGDCSTRAISNLILTSTPCSLTSWLDQAFRLRLHCIIPNSQRLHCLCVAPWLILGFWKSSRKMEVYTSAAANPNRHWQLACPNVRPTAHARRELVLDSINQMMIPLAHTNGYIFHQLLLFVHY